MTICSVEKCDRNISCMGLCATHYQRLRRTGRVSAKRGIGMGKGNIFIQENKNYSGQDCLIWPFGKASNGYGQLTVDYKTMNAHRFMCEVANGEPPTIKHQAAHSCGNRACVNPRHLRWATAKENTHDKYIHNTMQFGQDCHTAKLTNKNAIKAFFDDRPVTEIAKELGVTKDTIHKLKRGCTFSRVTKKIEMYEAALGGV